jgi:hypothetical protein
MQSLNISLLLAVAVEQGGHPQGEMAAVELEEC